MSAPLPSSGSLWPIALIALGVLGLVAYVYATKPKRQQQEDARTAAQAKRQAIADCVDLEHQIREGRLAGLDQTNSAALEQRYRSCLETNGLDVSRAPLVTAQAMREQVGQEYSHLKATNYADPAQRENTFNTLVRVESDFIRQLQAALDLATTREGVDAIVAEARGMADESLARYGCFKASAGGCDRAWGQVTIESRSGDQKSTEEYENCYGPIVGYAYALSEQNMDSALGRQSAAAWGFIDRAAAKRAALPSSSPQSIKAALVARPALNSALRAAFTSGLRVGT